MPTTTGWANTANKSASYAAAFLAVVANSPLTHGYWESYDWHGTAIQILTKSCGPEHLVQVLPKFSMEVEKLLDDYKAAAQIAWTSLNTLV